jgi:hypothetical protein
MKTPTVTSVRAKVKRAAAAEGFYLKLVHSKAREWREADLRVAEGYGAQARDAGLANWSDLNRKQSLADWLRQVLTAEELRTVRVDVEVSNSDPMTDYFDIRWERVLPDWESYVRLGHISLGWAKDLLGVDEFGSMYDRGTRRFTKSEVAALAPSEAHAWALAFFVTHVSDCRNAAAIDQLTKLNDAGRSLFEVMLPNWEAGVLNLFEAVAALVPQEAPVAPVVEPEVPVERLTEQPQALADYLGRLLHEPKRDFAQAVWFSLANNTPVPSHEAPWADDVIKKVRRYADA